MENTFQQPLYKKLFGNKEFYKMMLAVAVPILIQTAISNFVSLLDNIMVGRLNTEAMSGVSISNELIFVFNLGIFGATSGVGIFTAQYFGSNNKKGLHQSIRFSMYWSLIILTIGLCVFGLFNKQLISLFLHSSNAKGDLNEVSRLGREYIKIMLIGLPAFTISQVYSGTMRCTKKTFIPMLSSVIAVQVNLVLNYVLIYGKFGAPALGVQGAAIATVISRYVEMFILLFYSHLNKNPDLQYFKEVWKSLYVPKDKILAFLKKGTPIFLNEMFWSLGMTMITQSYSIRGITAVAALNISNTLFNLFASGFIAMGNAVGIIVGNILGENKLKEAKETSVKLMTFTVILCTCLMFMFIGLAFVFPKIYETEEAVRHTATILMIISASLLPLEAIVNAVYFTIRAGGKTFLTFLFDSFFTWVVPVPVAVLLSRLTDLKLEYMYLIVKSLDIIKVIIGSIILKSNIWCKKFVTEG